MLAMTAYGMPISAAVAPGAQASEIVGNVLGPDALTAVSGASVKAAHTTTQKVYASQSTGADGVYKLSDLPPGSYDLAVQTSDGLFPADAVVEVMPGRRTMVSLAIRTDARQEGDKPADPNAPPPADPNAPKPADPNAPKPADPNAPPAQPQGGEKPPEPAPQPPPKKKGGGFWRSPAGAAIAIVGGAALIGVAANSAASDDEEDTPPLTQSGN
ncbi:MAG: carboxypeptidase-like regulatory domain-containing protein [Candidatus Polarisedimenticolia bacterium]